MTDRKSSMETIKPEIVEGSIEPTRNRSLYSPRTDIIEKKEQYLINADIPGCDEKGVRITLEKNVLTIHATGSTQAPESMTLILSEYGAGDYYRSFALSDEIDREKIEAKVGNGVLELILPKAGPARAQTITVKPG